MHCHEFVHSHQERVDLTGELLGSHVLASAFNERIGMGGGCDLEFGESFCYLGPRASIRSVWLLTLYFFRKPAIPAWMNSQDSGNVIGEEAVKSHADRKFLDVGLTRGLEPDRSTGCFDSHEAKRGTRVELLELAGRMEPERFDLVANPAEELLDPTRFRKWTLPRFCDVAIEVFE